MPLTYNFEQGSSGWTVKQNKNNNNKLKRKKIYPTYLLYTEKYRTNTTNTKHNNTAVTLTPITNPFFEPVSSILKETVSLHDPFPAGLIARTIAEYSPTGIVREKKGGRVPL